MSNCITVHNEITTPGLLDKMVRLEQPLSLNTGRELHIQCTSVEISDLIPNIFNGYPYGVNFDNTRLRIGNDVDGWVTVQLDMGRYSAEHISAAVNALANSLGWWTLSTDPGFALTGNPIIQKHVISIDSTKLAAGHGTQFMVDLSTATTGGSMLYYSLGYTSTTLINTDGLFPSPNLPVMETQGTACIIETELIEARRYGTEIRRVLAEVPFAGKTSFSNSVWPQGAQISPEMIYTGPRQINMFFVGVRTRDNKPMIFMGGIMSLTLRFTQ